MSESMIERVENAIVEAMNADPKGGSFSRAARAAIAAMREPTKAMNEAGFDAVWGSVDAVLDGPIKIQSDAGSAAWRAMIDEALCEDAQ